MLRFILCSLFAILFSAAVSAAEPVQVKIMSFNIWYGGDQVDFNGIIEAIKKADPDIVGLQEPDGKTLEIAALAGYPYADVRRHIISKFPLFDSGVGERTEEGNPLYSIAGVILGGGEFIGGRVSPMGAVIGALTLALAGSFLIFLRISPDWQIGAQGAILIIVLALRALVTQAGKVAA